MEGSSSPAHEVVAEAAARFLRSAALHDGHLTPCVFRLGEHSHSVWQREQSHHAGSAEEGFTLDAGRGFFVGRHAAARSGA